MSTLSKGHFATKHPPGTQVSTDLEQAVRKNLKDGGISCHNAHDIARDLKVPPGEVGVAIDLAEGRILKCQLGLFGYGKGKKMVKTAKSIMPALRDAIVSSLENDRLPCAAAWRIAEEHTIPRLAVANACEMLGVRIKPCQLGAF
jgi:hypothetical protein